MIVESAAIGSSLTSRRWTRLSGEAKRYIENALIAGTGASAAEANVETIGAVVENLGR